MTAEAPKRGKPWALLAVLGGIGLGTLGMCGVGGWLVVHYTLATVEASSEAMEAARGPLEVRSDAYRVVMRRTPEEDVELFEGPLAQNDFSDAILRRLEYDCDVQLRVRTVGADAEVVPWMDFVTNGWPDGEPTLVHVNGLDTEAVQRRYLSNNFPFTVIGFVHGDVLFTLDHDSDHPDCVARSLASIEVLGGEMVLPTVPSDDISGPTFRIANHRFESVVSGLVIDAPAEFTFASTDATNTWIGDDEAVLMHANGSEVHVATVGLSPVEMPFLCAPNEPDVHSISATFGGSARVFRSTDTPPHQSLHAAYCVGQTLIKITGLGPNQSRVEAALRALENRVHVETANQHDMGGHQRVGLADWSFRDDRYQHTSGMTWRRPPLVEVRTAGIVAWHEGYPEQHVQLEFQRRDLSVTGAVWTHPTEASATDYHEAFVLASLTQLEATSECERIDQPFASGTCGGTRSELTCRDFRNLVATCVRGGWAVAFEARIGQIEIEGAPEFANAALSALSTGEVSITPTFQVDGRMVDTDGACSFATAQRGPLALNVASCASWSRTGALSSTTYAAWDAGAFTYSVGNIDRARIFASTTPATSAEVSGFHAEERRMRMLGRELRVYSVIVDATAYVITLHGPVSTPESAWSELLATVHIDP